LNFILEVTHGNVKSILWAAGINLIKKTLMDCKTNLAFTCAVTKKKHRFYGSSDITAAFSTNPGSKHSIITVQKNLIYNLQVALEIPSVICFK